MQSNFESCMQENKIEIAIAKEILDMCILHFELIPL